MDSLMDMRRSLRFRVSLDTLISAEPGVDAGVLADISHSGARLEKTSTQPEVGSKVTLYVFIQPFAPFELHGHVARLTETGFAVMYELFDPEIRQLVDDVSAVVRGESSQ
jgi:hypothetical protein